jgi:hypothetical protein
VGDRVTVIKSIRMVINQFMKLKLAEQGDPQQQLLTAIYNYFELILSGGNYVMIR